jgi:PAS domain S-box-containing protein
LSATAAALLLRWLFESLLGPNLPFATLFGAVALSVWYGGLGPALFTTVGGFIAASYFFKLPLDLSAALVGFFLYLTSCLIIIGFATGMKRAQRRYQLAAVEAQEQRESLRVTLSSIGDAVIATDTRGRITFMNPVTESLTGWTRQEAEGRPLGEVFKIINAKTRQPAEDPVGRVLKEGVVVALANHTELIARNGAEIPIDDSAAPIKDRGRLIGVVLVFRDVTERNRAEETKALLAAIVESTQDAVIGKTLDGTIISWNAGAERLYGYSAAEAIGRPVSMLIPSDHPDEMPRIMDRISRGERIESYETVRQAKDGRRIDVLLTISPIKDPEGTITGASKIAHDITGQKRAERVLRQSEARLRTLLETTLNAVVGMDEQGRITEWNPQATKIFGHTKEDAVGRRTSELIMPERFRESHEAGLRRFLSTGKGPILNKRVELTALRRDGTEFSIELAVTALTEDGRRLFYGFISDITERKRFEEGLKQRSVDAEEAARIKSEFLSSFSHEIRTPLNAIIGYSALLKSPEQARAPEQQTRMIERISYNSQVLLNLINNILDLSRIEAGGIQIQLEEVSLAGLLKEVINSVESLRVEKGLEVVLQDHSAVPLIRSDPGKLGQIFTNLIGNAIKYTEKGSITARISDHPEGKKVSVRIEDTGIGISENDLSRIFEPFYQAGSSEAGSLRGTGLGLSIVKKLVDALDGTVQVESRLGSGSIFTVTLPYRIIEERR